MSSLTKRPTPSPVKESDIIVHPDGEITISFLWDDLIDLLPESDERRTKAAAPSTERHTIESRTPLSCAPLEFPLDEYRQCLSCPKQCGFDRVAQRHSTCGDFELRVATSGLTHGDEPEIRGTRGSGAIMLSGCPLRCPSCHNPEMVASGKATSLQRFVELAFELEAQGAHNLQILSPTVHFPALRVALRELKRSRLAIPVLFKSSGYERVEELQTFRGLVDIYLPDFKFGACSSWAARAGVRNYFKVASAAIREMIEQTGALQLDEHGVAKRGVLVRHVQAPLPEAEKLAIQRFLSELPAGVGVSLIDRFVTL